MAHLNASQQLAVRLIDGKDLALLRECLLKLWERQTVLEKVDKRTFHRNGVGFDQWDAKLLSRLALALRDRLPTGGEAMILSERLPKYCRQLVKES